MVTIVEVLPVFSLNHDHTKFSPLSSVCAFVDCTGLCLFYLVCYYLKEVEVKGNIKPKTEVNKYKVEEKINLQHKKRTSNGWY